MQDRILQEILSKHSHVDGLVLSMTTRWPLTGSRGWTIQIHSVVQIQKCVKREEWGDIRDAAEKRKSTRADRRLLAGIGNILPQSGERNDYRETAGELRTMEISAPELAHALHRKGTRRWRQAMRRSSRDVSRRENASHTT